MKKIKKNILSIFNEKKVEVLPIINKNNIVNEVYFKNDFNKKINQDKKNLNCELIIMAGGFGKRLKPFTEV